MCVWGGRYEGSVFFVKWKNGDYTTYTIKKKLNENVFLAYKQKYLSKEISVPMSQNCYDN